MPFKEVTMPSFRVMRKTAPRGVALARAEQKEKYRIKYRRRQYLYQLRALEKRGRELESEGWIPGEDDEDPLED